MIRSDRTQVNEFTTAYQSHSKQGDEIIRLLCFCEDVECCIVRGKSERNIATISD